MKHHSISVEQLHDACATQPVQLVDVRTPAEFSVGHALAAINLPLDRLEPAQLAHVKPDQPIYLICKSGARAQKALEKLRAAGFNRALVVLGGTDAWIAAGYPIRSGGGRVISLERQVRIAAGALVVAGVMIGIASPVGMAIAGLIGAGLVFSGVTDTCGMASVLSRMPWNNSRTAQCGVPDPR